MAIGMKPAISDIVVAAVFIAGIAAMAATYGSQDNWISHSILGAASLGLILEIDIVGAMAAGRIRKPKDLRPFPVHKKASGQFLAVSIGSYLFGIWIRFQHGDPVMATPHGWIGLAVCLIAVPQWLSCRYKVRRAVKLLHIGLGYGLLAILVVQIALGVWMAFFNS
jgi:hypothetical protein